MKQHPFVRTAYLSVGCLGSALAWHTPVGATVDVMLRLDTAWGHTQNAARLATEDLRAANAVGTDSNVLRLRTDWGVLWRLGHPDNRLKFTHQIRRRDHSQLPVLDGNTHVTRIDASFGSLPWLGVDVQASHQQSPELPDVRNPQPLANLGTDTQRSAGLVLTLKPSPHWSVPVAVSSQESATDSGQPQDSGFVRSNTTQIGVAWRPQPDYTVSVDWGRTHYRTSPLLWNAGTDPTQRPEQQGTGFKALWNPSPRTTLSAGWGRQRWHWPLVGGVTSTQQPWSLAVDHRYSVLTRMDAAFRSETLPDFQSRSGLVQRRSQEWGVSWAASAKTRVRLDATLSHQTPLYQDGGLRGSETTRSWAFGSRLEHEWRPSWTAYIEWITDRSRSQSPGAPARNVKQQSWALGLRYDWSNTALRHGDMGFSTLP